MGKSALEVAIDNAQYASNQANTKISELGEYTSKMYKALTDIQHQFDLIRNIPSDKQFVIASLNKTRVTWKQQAEKIEADYKNVMSAYKRSGATGAGLGVGVAALGPTAAMGIATTFGVASTGTAISTLSGAAATNAALAWLGGGAMVAGGGGIAAGNAFLAMAGPVGWGIAAVSIVVSGIFYWIAKNEKERLEKIYTLISERDVKKYKTAIIEINERIRHIAIEHHQIIQGVEKIKTFGYDYRSMTTEQQFALGTYVELMESSTELLVNPIMGLQPSYTEDDYNLFFKDFDSNNSPIFRFISLMGRNINKKAVIAIANLLYNVQTDSDDREILSKSFKKNEEFLKTLGYTKDNYPEDLLTVVNSCLTYKYFHPTSKKEVSSQSKYSSSNNKTSEQTNSNVELQYVYNGSDIERIVKMVIAKSCNMYPDSIYGYQNISTLGAHIGTISAKLENEFGISIPADYVRNMHTVNDAIRFVKQLSGSRSNTFNIEGKVYEIIAKISNRYPSTIQGYQNISCLGANVGSVAAQLENAFGIKIPADYVRNMHTVDDAVRYVKVLLQ